MMHRIMLVLVLATAPGLAQTGPTPANPAARPAPRSIGTWYGWEAFTSQEAGTTVCYLVSRPFSAVPSMEGLGELALTVTRRPGREDTVAVAVGSADVSRAGAMLRIAAASFPLDMGPDGASVREAAAAVEVMKGGLQAVANFERSQGARATVTYSLRGFKAAYGTTRRVCPER